jgi:YD repeat-containing protein
VERENGIVTIIAPHGQHTRLALDANGYLASVTDPNGAVTHVTHTDTGLLTNLVDVRAGTHHFQYDELGRLSKDTDATPGSPGIQLAEERDDNGRTVEATGWVAGTRDPAGLGVSFGARDGNGRPLSMELPGGRSLAMGYDAGGNVVSVTPPEKRNHGFLWDPANRMSDYEPPNVGFLPKNTTYGYDFDGLLVSLLPPQNPVAYAYDDVGRVTNVSSYVDTTFVYDLQGRLGEIATSDGVFLTNS